MPDDVNALRKQLEAERALHEALAADNARLEAQVEAYAEDMASLFQEQHGRGTKGLAAEAADLRSQLADQTAQREVVGRLHKRSVERSGQLSDQLVSYGEDLSKAFREGKRSATAHTPLWRKLFGVIPMAATVGGLLIGAGGYAVLSPTPVPTLAAVGEGDPLYGPARPPELGGPGILVASGGSVQRFGAGTAGPIDPAGLAATAVAAAFAAPGTATPAPGTPSASPGPGTPAATSGTAVPAGTRAAGAAAAGQASPVATGAANSGLAATVTAFAATGTVLAGIATAASADATARALAPMPSTTPTLVVIKLSPEAEKERCRFEMLLPVLAPGAAYAIRFEQRQPADLVVLWSDPAGTIALEGFGPDGTARPLGRTADATPGQGVVLRNAAAGGYQALLVKRGGETADSRVALFYDAGATCSPAPGGAPANAPPGAINPAPTVPPATITPPASTPRPVPSATQPPAPPTVVPVGPTAPPLPTPLPSATSVPATAVAVATLPPTQTTSALSPTPLAATATPVRPYVDCRPYLRGPSRILELHPQVWMDLAHTVLGTWPMRATLTGPGVGETADFTASPGGPPQRLSLGGFGNYRLRVEAIGADMDPACSWDFQHDIYS